jgi:hypothetical protein
LAANGANCSSGQAPLGVDASGAAEGCWTPKDWLGNEWVSITDYYGTDSTTTTTGDISSGTNVLTVASASTWVDNQGITVVGAGTAGGYLKCAKVSISGTTFTLYANDGSTPCNASTTVNDGAVWHDSSWQLYNAIATGKNVLLPGYLYYLNMGAGTYTLSTANQIITGTGMYNTVLDIIDTNSAVFKLTADKITIKDLYIYKAVTETATSGSAIQIGDEGASALAQFPIIQHIAMNGVYKCLLLDDASTGKVFDFECTAPVSIGVHLDNNNPYGDFDMNHINITGLSATAIGIQFDEADINHWRSVKTNGDGVGLFATGSNGYVAGQEFIQSSFECNGVNDYIVKLTKAGANAVSSFQFIGGNMANYTGNKTDISIGNGVTDTQITSVTYGRSTDGVAIYNAGQNTRIINVNTGGISDLSLATTSTGSVVGSYFDTLTVAGAVANMSMVGNTFVDAYTGTDFQASTNMVSGNKNMADYLTTTSKFVNPADSTTGFQIFDADGGTPILNVDTTNERIGIGTATPGAALDIVGSAFISTGIKTAKAYPAADGTTAYQITKADGSTVVLNIDTTNALMSVGGTTPLAQIEATTDGIAASRGVGSSQYSTDVNGALYTFRKARGTKASPAAVADGDELGAFYGYGADTAVAFKWGGIIDFVVQGTPAANHIPTAYRVYTDDGISLTQKWIINAGGTVGYSPKDANATPVAPTANLKFFGYNKSLAADANDAFTSGTDGLTLPAVTTSGYLVITTSGGLTLQANVAADGTATVIYDSGAGIEYQAAIASCTELCLYDVGSNANIWNDSAGTLIVNVMFWYN